MLDFIDKISITCFAASYSVALLLEITRVFFRSGIRGALMLAFAGAGLIAHTAFLAHWWYAGGHAPLASEFDWYLAAAWVLVVVYLYLTWYHPRNPIGLFTLPIVLALVAVAHFWASPQPLSRTEQATLLGWSHGAFLLLGTVAVLVGFISGLMYLLHAYRLKHKLPQRRGFELPSLEWLQKVNTRSIAASVVLLLGGFGTGVLLSYLRHGAVHWSDPVVWGSSLLVGWMTAVAVFNVVYKPARQGRKVAYVMVFSMVFLILTLAALLLDPNHGQPSAAETSTSQQTGLLDVPAEVGS